MTASERNHQTSAKASGVRTPAGDADSQHVHAFHRWLGETIVETWCGIEVNLADGGAHTRDLITCLGCAQASLKAIRGAA